MGRHADVCGLLMGKIETRSQLETSNQYTPEASSSEDAHKIYLGEEDCKGCATEKIKYPVDNIGSRSSSTQAKLNSL